MPSNRELVRLMEDATSFCDSYRSANIDAKHRAADNMWHMLHENSAEYEARGRSQLYLPKVRNHIRRWTTTIVNAFFSSDDIVTLSYPVHDAKQRFTNEVFNRRLERDCNFFMFLANAAHSHLKYGNAVGKTGWEYAEDVVETREYFDPVTQETVREDVTAPTVDRPFFEVVPFENVQIDYRCVGPDPVQESPFLREWIPMYVNDVERNFKTGLWKKPRSLDWRTVLVPTSTDVVRKRRSGTMGDPQAEKVSGDDPGVASYDQVWVVNNFFRVGGTDWNFTSLGDEAVLDRPERTIDKFPHGKRPYSFSKFDPEAFRVYSSGLPEIMKSLQYETNAIRNQRRDNVSLVLNKQWAARRGAGIQLQSLVNSRPGGVILGDNIDENSLRMLETPDVTASSYREEEIATRDLEEVSGQNRNMMGVQQANRTTATEAAITASASGEMEGYVIKSFVETFIRPLLEMFMDNIVAYENDERTLVEAAIATDLPPDPSLLARCEIVINAGMGSVNKELKSARISQLVDRCIQLAPVDITFAQSAKQLMRDLLPLAGVKNVDKYIPAAAQSPVQPPPDQTAGAVTGQGGQMPMLPQPGMGNTQISSNLGGFAHGMIQ